MKRRQRTPALYPIDPGARGCDEVRRSGQLPPHVDDEIVVRMEVHVTGIDADGVCGYTFGMKTAVSIPDNVFARAERFAKLTGRSRSEVYSSAVREYVARHDPDDITETMNSVVDAVDEAEDRFVNAAAIRILRRTEW